MRGAQLGGLGFERRTPSRMMPRLILAWCLLSFLALLGACGSAGKLAGAAAGAALGGGPEVAANVQAGRTNAQVLGAAQLSEQKMVRPQARTIEQSAGKTGVRAEAVQAVTVHNEAPPWVWLIAILAVGLAAVAVTDEIRDRLARRKDKEFNHADG